MRPKHVLSAGAILAGLGVILGAFGAHSFEATLESLGRTETYQTASEYHLYHALGLVVVGLLGTVLPKLNIALVAWAFLLGILIFSGSLYTLSLTGITWLGAITPLGGVCFIGGWGVLAWRVVRYQS